MVGSGQPGEIWFAEADTPLGPWVWARRVVTHHDYNFYNPTQHSFFDQEGGRVIYFEGTYTATFSGAKQKTPRYDYNQIMYRLNLDDPRLDLPAPVYAVREPDGTQRLMMRPDLDAAQAWTRIDSIPFFALPGTSRRAGQTVIYSAEKDGTTVLHRERPPNTSAPPLFQVLSAAGDGPTPPGTALLYEYRRVSDRRRFYAARADLGNPEQEHSPEPLGRVWRNPMSVVILDAEVTAASTEPR